MTREKNRAELEADAVRADPELQAALGDLKKDAPPGQGPFLQDTRHLRRPAKESERQEAGVAEITTNPVARDSRTALENKVVVKPKPADTPEADQARAQQITIPGVKKKEALGIVEDLEFGGRALAGTLKFKNPIAPPPAEAAPDVVPSSAVHVQAPVAPVAPPTEIINDQPPKNGPSWIWVAVILLSLAAVVGIVIVASTRGPAELPTSTERTATAQVATTATATQTAVVAVETVDTARVGASAAAPESTSARTVVSDETAAPGKSTVREKPSPPATTSPTVEPPAASSTAVAVPAPQMSAPSSTTISAKPILSPSSDRPFN